MKTLVIGLALTSTVLSQSLVFAGTERSGGNLLESSFSKAISQIEGELDSLGNRAKTKLKFSTEKYADASSGITVECASLQDDIDYLQSKKRLAFVKNAGNLTDKVIYLNCYIQSPLELILTPDWQDVLDGITNKKELSTTAKVLVVHEIFRAGGLEVKEGDYSLSSSIKIAQLEQDLTIKEQLVDMIAGTSNKCEIYFSLEYGCGSNEDFVYGNFEGVNLVKKNKGFFGGTTKFFKGCSREDTYGTQAESIINLKLSSELTRRTLMAANSAQCFDGR